jgi:hypothetical protein
VLVGGLISGERGCMKDLNRAGFIKAGAALTASLGLTDAVGSMQGAGSGQGLSSIEQRLEQMGLAVPGVVGFLPRQSSGRPWSEVNLRAGTANGDWGYAARQDASVGQIVGHTSATRPTEDRK